MRIKTIRKQAGKEWEFIEECIEYESSPRNAVDIWRVIEDSPTAIFLLESNDVIYVRQIDDAQWNICFVTEHETFRFPVLNEFEMGYRMSLILSWIKPF